MDHPDVASLIAAKPDFWTWLQYGKDAGWIGDADCMTHNGLPGATQDIIDMWDEGLDPCEVAMRVYPEAIDYPEVDLTSP